MIRVRSSPCMNGPGFESMWQFLLEERRIEWRVLRDERYELLQPDASGIFRSTVFPGLWLDEPAYWRND